MKKIGSFFLFLTFFCIVPLRAMDFEAPFKIFKREGENKTVLRFSDRINRQDLLCIKTNATGSVLCYIIEYDDPKMQLKYMEPTECTSKQLFAKLNADYKWQQAMKRALAKQRKAAAESAACCRDCSASAPCAVRMGSGSTLSTISEK